MTPPVYNKARVNEQPVPNVNPPNIDDNSNADPNKAFSGSQETRPCQVIIEPLQPFHITASSSNAVMENIDKNGEQATSSSNAAMENIDENDEQVTISTSFEEVLVGTFDPSNIEIKEEDPLELMNDFEDEVEDLVESSLFYEIISDELVMFYVNQNSFKRKATNLRFKVDDVLTGALPFKEYVSFEKRNQ